MSEVTATKLTDTAHAGAGSEDELFLAFFGKNGEKFVKTLHRMREKDPALRIFVMSWCWPAFFIAVPWYFYRKMYAWGVVLVAMPTVLELLLGKGGSAGNIAFFTFFAIMAKSLYVHHASRQLKRLRAGVTSEAELLERAKERGGGRSSQP
jgi:hypothetical protein